MKIEELPLTLRNAVKAYIPIAKDNGYDTESGALGWCLAASDEFLHILEEHGVDTKTTDLLRHYVFKPLNNIEEQEQFEDEFLPVFPFKPRKNHYYHFAVKVGNIVIDWTARQFGGKNPFPAIWKEE